MLVFHSHSPFDFGKHRGRSLEDVASDDPDYILWCVENGVLDTTFATEDAKQVIEDAKLNAESFRECDATLGDIYG